MLVHHLPTKSFLRYVLLRFLYFCDVVVVVRSAAILRLKHGGEYDLRSPQLHILQLWHGYATWLCKDREPRGERKGCDVEIPYHFSCMLSLICIYVCVYTDVSKVFRCLTIATLHPPFFFATLRFSNCTSDFDINNKGVAPLATCTALERPASS